MALLKVLFCISTLTLFWVCSISGAELGEKLLLSKFIKSGKLEEAREASLVSWGQDKIDGIQSYTGFITVNETTNSNLFFWFIPSVHEEPEDVPVMLWLNGGPGTTSMYGLFVENGPFTVKKRGRIPRLALRVRKDTWARKHSMLYIDSPVGTGFSFTDDDSGYAKTQDDISRDLYNFLQQFFVLFPDFSKQDFYMAGESYAGKYVPHLGVKIHEENEKENATKILLKGIITGGPYTDPLSMSNQYSDYYYYLGLIDEQGRDYFKTQEALITKLIEEGNLDQALQVKDELLFSKYTPNPPSYFRNQSGYNYFHNALETKTHKKRYYYAQFLNLTSTRRSIHVGDQQFNNVSRDSRVLQELKGDILLSCKADMEKLINLQYKVLIYVGQFDLIIPHTAVTNFIRSMNFDEKEAFEKSERRIIRDRKKGDVSGYVKSAGKFYYVIVRNAGHSAPRDEPRKLREIIEKFVNPNPFEPLL